MFFKNFSTNFKDSIIYSIGNYIYVFSITLSNIVINRILGPEIVGSISFINAIDRNVDFLYAPFRAAIDRELPKLLVRDHEASQKFIFANYLLNIIFILIGSIFYIFCFFNTTNEYIKLGFYYFIIINLIKPTADLLRITLKSNRKFTSLAFVLISISLAHPILLIYLTNELALKGFYIARIISFLILLLMLIYFTFIISPSLFSSSRLPDKSDFKRIFILGIPIMSYGLIVTLMSTIDRLFIKHFLGLEQLGYYSMGIIFFQMLLLLPNSIYGSYFPKFMSNENDQYENIIFLTQIVKVINLPVIALSWVLIPIFIKIVLPEFIPGINVVKIMLIGYFFNSIYQMYYYEIIKSDELKKLLYRAPLILIISLPLYYLMLINDFGINGTACVTVFSLLMLSLLNISLGQKIMKKTSRETIELLVSHFLYLIPIMPLLIIDLFYTSSIVTEFIKIAIFIILFIPFALNLVNDKRFISIIK